VRERVLEHQPVPDLVGERVALRVLARRASRHRLVEDHDPVAEVAAVVVALREVRPAEQAAADVRRVHVERAGVAAVERSLHLALDTGLAGHDGVPVGVHRPRDLGESEPERRIGRLGRGGPGEGVVQDLHLGSDQPFPAGLLGGGVLVVGDHVEDRRDANAPARQRRPVVEHAVGVGLVLRIELRLLRCGAVLHARDRNRVVVAGGEVERGTPGAHAACCLPREHCDADQRRHQAHAKRGALTHETAPFQSLAVGRQGRA
jgi:hypothetical protein